jgi:hypothetical protein
LSEMHFEVMAENKDRYGAENTHNDGG